MPTYEHAGLTPPAQRSTGEYRGTRAPKTADLRFRTPWRQRNARAGRPPSMNDLPLREFAGNLQINVSKICKLNIFTLRSIKGSDAPYASKTEKKKTVPQLEGPGWPILPPDAGTTHHL